MRGWKQASIARLTELLEWIGLGRDRNEQPHYPDDLAATVRDLTYPEEFAHYSSKRLFDILLIDGGIFQFAEERYAFYQQPADVLSFEAFAHAQLEILGVDFEHLRNDTETLRDLFSTDYDLEIDTARMRTSFTPIRYDHQPSQYRPCVHPAAHVHIGTNNNIRLALARRMTPLAFGMFVLRQSYPESWNSVLAKMKHADVTRALREDLEMIELQNSDDLCQLILE
jgi:hypothetical protein